MLHDLANDGGYVALKWAAEDREGRRHRNNDENLLYSRRLLRMMILLNFNRSMILVKIG